MTAPRIGAPSPALDAQHTKLRAAAHQLEGVFMAQLFQAMRGSQEQDPIVSGGAAGEMFQGMMDDQIAERAAQRLDRGVGEALYRQLSRHLNSPPSGVQPAPKGE